MGACESSSCCGKKETNEPKISEENTTSNMPIKESICQIKSKTGKYGIGFFARIPFPTNDKFFNVLITSNQLLNSNDFSPGKQIQLELKQSRKNIILNIDNNRKFYSCNEYNNISIIEIRKEDNITNVSFLDTGNYINQDGIYLIYYNNNQNEQYYFGNIINISDNIFRFNHSDININMHQTIGCPILNQDNKVIGMNITINNIYNNNDGILLKNAIENFYDEYSNNYIKVIFYDQDYNKEYKVKVLYYSMFGELVTEFYLVSRLDDSDFLSFIFNNIEIPCYSFDSLINLNIINNSKIYVYRKTQSYNVLGIHLIFSHDNGHKICIRAQKSMKTKELIMRYSQKIRVPYKKVINKYRFIYNVKTIIIGEETLQYNNLPDGANIAVFY